MVGLIPSEATLLAFLAASFVLAITPGPAVLFILTQTLSQGRRAGLASIAGIALGNLGNAAAASVGLAAILATSTTAFFIVKLAGAAYLIYLGVKALRQKAHAVTSAQPANRSHARLFRDGFVVALLNPKTALFFAAFLPQFMNPAASALGQSLIFGSLFVAMALCTDTSYALAASTLAPALNRRSHWRPMGRYVSAATFFGLGIYAALSSPRATK